MSKKNTRNALDTSLSYAVIGLDLAKADCRLRRCSGALFR